METTFQVTILKYFNYYRKISKDEMRKQRKTMMTRNRTWGLPSVKQVQQTLHSSIGFSRYGSPCLTSRLEERYPFISDQFLTAPHSEAHSKPSTRVT